MNEQIKMTENKPCLTGSELIHVGWRFEAMDRLKSQNLLFGRGHVRDFFTKWNGITHKLRIDC